MFNIALTALVIAIVAALFGFGGIASAATQIALIVFYIAVAVLLISVVMGLINRNRGPNIV